MSGPSLPDRAAPSSTPEDDGGAPGAVLIVDDDDDLRDTLGETLAAALGRAWVGAAGFDGVTAIRERALACSVAILDVNLGSGQPSGLDVYEWLQREGYRGRIVFLTGHARSHPLVDRAARVDGATVQAKPVSLATLCSIVRGPT